MDGLSLDTPRPADLSHLVEHRASVDASQSVAEILDFFGSVPHDFAAVLEGDRVIGACGRSQIRGQLAGRYGFALHSRAPVRGHTLPSTLLVHHATPLRELLECALVRAGDAFYEDVVVVGDGGELIGLVSTHRLVQAQSELIRSQFSLLEEQQRQIVAREKAALVETLASGIAHELNNKLMPIVGYSQLLLADTATLENPEIEEPCQMIFSAALDASRIIKQLSQLSRPSDVERHACDLRELVEQSLAFLNLRLKEYEIQVGFRLPVVPVVIAADGGQMRQVITNLVLNAIDAMDGSERRALNVQLTATSEDAMLAISDTGTGMTGETLSKIFDPFFTTKAPNRGTGLGLSVSQSIVHAHGGDITAESSVGRGTTIRLRFPIDQTQDTEAVTPSHIIQTHLYNHLRILVVEDDDAVAAVVARGLRAKLGCDVVRAENGGAACTYLADQVFDLILSDVRMPGMNGLELLSWVRKNRPRLLEKFVFMTGDASDSPVNAAIRRTAMPVLRKPLTVNDVIEGIRTVLDGRREQLIDAGEIQQSPLIY